jgi:putative ABC transport system substrate-binding protein
MRRRDFLGALGGTAAAWPAVVQAQQERIRRIGVLIPYPESDGEAQMQYDAFRVALRNLGWQNDSNIRIEARWTGGDSSQIGILAKGLIALRPEVILSRSTAVTSVLRQQTRTIPIVFVVVSDPIGDGFVASMARPGGNATGFTNVEASLGGKWLELINELTPGLNKVAVVYGLRRRRRILFAVG